MRKKNVKKNKGRKASKKRLLRKGHQKNKRGTTRKSTTSKKVARKSNIRRNVRQSTKRTVSTNRRRTNEPKLVVKGAQRLKRLPKSRRKSVTLVRQQGKTHKVTTQAKRIPRLLGEKQHVIKDGKPTRNYSGVLKLGLSKYKNFDDKVRAVREWSEESLIKYYQDKRTKLPRGFMIIIRTAKGRKHTDRAFKGIFTLHPDLENIRETVLEKMIEFQDQYFEALESAGLDEDDEVKLLEKTQSGWVFDPKQIQAVFIKFFYDRD